MAETPYFDDLKDLKDKGMDISFVYGDEDWLDTDLNEVKVSEQLKKAGFKVDVLEKCGHHLYFDNYDDLLKSMDDTLQDNQERVNDINSDK